MGIVRLYSKQLKPTTGQSPQIYRHDSLPESLRVQFGLIWDEAIGFDNHPWNATAQAGESTCANGRARFSL
jgi:hypothetical protein